MKKLLTIGLFCAIVLSSKICCAQDNGDQISGDFAVSEKLQGKWQMDEKSIVKQLKVDDKDKLEQMPMKLKEDFEKSIASKVFSFGNGGLFNAKWISRGTNQQVEGQYFILNGEMLRIVVHGNTEQFLIEELDSMRMVLNPQGNQRGMLKKLIFNRITEK